MSSAILATQLTSSCIIWTDCRGMNTGDADAVVVTCRDSKIPVGTSQFYYRIPTVRKRQAERRYPTY
jgi:hypothetical protein